MKNIVRFVSVYVCTIIGASFITGNEVFTFFARFGTNAYFLVALSFILFICFSFVIFYKCKKSNISNLLDAFKFGHRKGFSLLMLFFTYITYFMFASIMLAGLRELFGTLFTILSAIIGFVLIKQDIRAIIIINTMLLPMVILYLVFLAVISNSGQSLTCSINLGIEGVFNILTYVSLNIILIFGSMLKLSNNMTKWQLCVAIVLSGIVFALLITWQIVILSNNQITNFSMPLIEVASKNNFVYVFALIVAYMAMISSYLSSTYSLYLKLKKSNQCNFYLIIMLLAMLALSFLSFAQIIKFSYVFLGIISLVLVFYLCIVKLYKK